MNTQANAKPVTAVLRRAVLARAITDGEIVLATVDIAASPERVIRALLTTITRARVGGR